ncbi:MAG: winged helix-turn-helix domain-containing protein [Nitrososphaeraceae archaeon]
MLIENSIINCDDEAIEMLREIADKTTYRIIIAIIHSPKTAAQICAENKLPQSSTYKRIRKLQEEGLITIEKISIDSKGKKVVLYRSKIKSLVFNLKANMKSLQFNKNDEMIRHTHQVDNDAMMS